MSWIEDKSVKRIFNTFKRLKLNIFNEDIEALKILNESLENAKIKQVNDNLLYAKLLCVFLKQNTEYYRDIKIAIKSIDDILKKDLNYHLEFLRISITNVEMEVYLKSIGFSFDLLKNDDELIKSNQKEIIDKLNKNWDIKLIEKSFFNTANSFLKDIENYK